MFSDDLIRDILARVVRAAQRDGSFTESLADEIEQQVRRDWAGETAYIARSPAEARRQRDESIRQEWAQGNRDIRALSVRFRLSQRRIRQLIDN